MPAIILPSKWTQQPQGPLSIDYANPLSRGICGVAIPNNGKVLLLGPGRHELFGINYDSNILTGDVTGLGTAPYSRFNLSSTGNDTTSQWELPSTGVTVFALTRRIGTGTSNPIIFGNSDANASPYTAWGLQDRGGAGNLRFEFAATSYGYVQVDSTLPAGSLIAACGTYDKAYGRLYVQGREVGTPAAATGLITYPNAGSRGPCIGGFFDSGGYYNGKVFIAIVYNRALSAGKVASLSANPWQIFKRDPQRIYFDVSTGLPTLTSIAASNLTSSGARLTVN